VEQRQPGDRPAEGAREEGRSRRRGRGRRDRQTEHQDNPNQQARSDQANRPQSGNGQARPPRDREQSPATVAREDLQPMPMAIERPAVERPVVEQPVWDQSIVAQPVVREPAAEETTRVEFVPAAAMPEQRPAPESAIEKPEIQTVVSRPQAAPTWKMEPVSLPPELVMIETQSKTPSIDQEPEAPRPARTPRPRYRPPAVPDEPLQQVETGKQQSAGSDAT